MLAARHPMLAGLLRGALVAAAVRLLFPVPAIALDAAPQASLQALVEDLEKALTAVRDLAPVYGIPSGLVAASTACDSAAAELGRCTPVLGCIEALAELYDAYAEKTDGESDVFGRRALARVTTELSDVLPRLGAASDQAVAGRCGETAPAGAVPGRLRLDADRRTAWASPLVGLRAGRRHALVLGGLPPATAEILAASVVPRLVDGRSEAPAGQLRAPLERLFAEAPPGVDVARARATAERVEADAAGLPGLPSLAVLQATFAAPLSGAALAALRVSFTRAGPRRPEGAVVVFEVLDGRAGLLAYRSRVQDLPCHEGVAEADDPKPVFGVSPPALGGLFRGRYGSLDLGGGREAERALGIAAPAARVVSLPYRLALPRDANSETPLVILVDGHMGSAVRSLRQHAAALLGRGLGALALELPEHGERDTPDGEFADRFDPLHVNRNLRQSAVDLMAMVHALRDCGLILPGGQRFRPMRISYLGYSLGAMVGVLAHGVEERLGPTVLLAGAGDFPGWLMLQLIPRLASGLVSCVGGPEHGRSCFPRGSCETPGRCAVDPMLFWLTEGFRPLYALLSAGADPVEFAARRTGPASKERLLLLTGGDDIILYPLLATRLSDAYGMRPTAPGVRRGPRSAHLHFPGRGHELVTAPDVQQIAYDFLAGGGRRLPRSLPATEPQD